MVHPDLRDHPMKRLLDAGVAVTLHSTTPPILAAI
jgi:adenosine deaminase